MYWAGIRVKRNISEDSMAEGKEEKTPSIACIIRRLSNLELHLQDLSRHKSEVLNNLSEIISELSAFLQTQSSLQAQIKADSEDSASTSSHISGLSKMLDRFAQLQNNFSQRRRVIERRRAYQLDALQNEFKARVIQAHQEAEADQAETVVAIFHKYRMSASGMPTPLASSLSSSLRSSKEDSTTDSPNRPPLLSQRKGSLQITKIPTLPQFSRRQSTAARFALSPSLRSPSVKSCADMDLLAIKSRLKE